MKIRTKILNIGGSALLVVACVADVGRARVAEARPSPADKAFAPSAAPAAGPSSTPSRALPPPTQSAQQRSPAPAQPAAPSAPPAAGAGVEPTTSSAPAAPQRVETINYGNWILTCRDTVEKLSKKVCSGTLQALQEKTQQVVLAWIIGRDNQGTLRTVIQTPTGIQIPKGLELTLGKAVRTMPFTACEPQRCEASLAVDDAMVKDAVAASEAKATIYSVEGRPVNFTLPIKGIDQIFAAIGK